MSLVVGSYLASRARLKEKIQREQKLHQTKERLNRKRNEQSLKPQR